MKINAETGKWLQNKTVAALVVGAVVGSFYLSGYLTEVDRAKKHVDESPARLAYYNAIIAEQKVTNTILIKDLKSAGEHRGRLETAINLINRHLERLQLVSDDIKPKELHAKNKKDTS